MSQAGLIDIETSHPQIPTSFLTDAGTAIPLANVLEVLGGEGIDTSGAGGTVTISCEIATAGATLLAANRGVCAFSNVDFVVTDGFVELAAGLSAINSILTDSGLPAVVPDGANQVQFTAGGGMTITGIGPGNVVTFTAAASVPTSFDADTGTAVPALNVLNVIGGNNIRTFGAANNLRIDLNDTTNHAVQIGNALGSLTSLAPLTNGQLVIGSTGADPATGSLASAGGTVVITNGAGTINLEAGGGVPTTFTTDAGNAVPALNILNVLGGNNIGTTGAGNNLTVNLNGTTDHAIQVGNATNSLTSLAVGTTGVILQGATGADPAWTTATYPSTAAVGDILYGSALNTVTGLAFVNTATRYIKNTGTGATLPEWGQVDLTNGVTGTLPVGNGGTGATTFTDHAVLVGSGSAAITAIAVGNTGELLVGATGADPAFATIAYGNFSFSNLTPATPRVLSVSNTDTDATSTASVQISVPPLGADGMVTWEIQGTGFYSAGVDNSDSDKWKLTNSSDPSGGDALLSITNAGVITLFNDLDVSEGGTGVSTLTSHGILMGNGAGDIQATAEPSDGQLLIGKTGDFPQLATLTAGTGVSITNAAGSVTIAAAGGGVTWTVVTDASATMAVNNGYVANRGTLVTLTLPATVALGNIIKVVNIGAGFVRIAQNAGDQITYFALSSTAGAGGYIECDAIGCSVELLAIAANTYWVINSQGNWTVA